MRGYPIDNRTAEQRARFENSVTGDFEYNVGRVVARLTGATAILQDDNSEPRTPDIRIEYPETHVGYGEVVTHTDPKRAELSSGLANDESRVPGELITPNLGRIWFVVLSDSARIKVKQNELPRLLANMQSNGLLFEKVARSTELQEMGNRLTTEAAKLGVVELSSRAVSEIDPKKYENGAILLYTEGVHGPAEVTWEEFSSNLDDILSSKLIQRKIAKLTTKGDAERHLIIGITYSTPWPVFYKLTDEFNDLPSLPPDLPEEISHLWLTNADMSGRCLVWFRGESWLGQDGPGWLDAQSHWTTG